MGEKKVYLVIHGHFYQPPRENPWLGIIEKQDSAYPFHDWNEKIYYECYRPNTISRILDEKLFIEDLVNNFEYYSFNFGPTLINWIKEKHPHCYKRIIEADRVSQAKNNGHGNALAQVYNHVIMPLAEKEDQLIQIKWGIEDFRFHFHREPEGMWLAETAINYEVVDSLIECGIRFTILSPYQALKVRKIGTEKWEDVSGGRIDTTKSYRIFSKKHRGKYLDVFFYDPDLSKEMAFNGLLKSAENLKRAFVGKIDRKKENQLINVAVDGETFGHHKPFADMCLAYFFKKESDIFTITNYANYLEMFPPEYEVELYLGEDGKGSSWSCAHGVGRWERNCGCKVNMNYPGDQKWRKNLRKCMNELRNKIDEIFKEKIVKYTPYKPLDVLEYYIQVKLYEDRDSFIETYFHQHITNEDKTKIFSLLEARYFAHLMFTSCGWFFDDIGGLEPIQNLKYAIRAIELVNPFTDENLLDIVVKNLYDTHSLILNISGIDIIRKILLPSKLSYVSIVSSFILNYHFLELNFCNFVCPKCFEINLLKNTVFKFDNIFLYIDFLLFRDKNLNIEKKYFAVSMIDTNIFDFKGYFLEIGTKEKEQIAEKLEDAIITASQTYNLKYILAKYQREYNFGEVSIDNLPYETRVEFLNTYFAKKSLETVKSIEKSTFYLESIFEKFVTNKIMPDELNREVLISFSKLILFRKIKEDDADIEFITRMIENVSILNLKVNYKLILVFLEKFLKEEIKKIHSLDVERLTRIKKILELLDREKISINITTIQDDFFVFLKNYEKSLKDMPVYYLDDEITYQKLENLLAISRYLRISTPFLTKIVENLKKKI